MGRMDRNHGDFSSVRVGAYGIRPTNEHIGGRTDQNRDDFFVRRWSGKGWLGGGGFSNSFGLGKLEVFFLRLFLLFLS